MNRKIEQAKKKRQLKASQQALTDKQVDTQERLIKAIDGLYELLNGQEQYDFDKLHAQLVEIDKRLDLAPLFKSLEKSIKDTSHKPDSTNKTKIDGFSELLRAVKDSKVTVNVDLKKLEKTVVDISQFIEEQSKPQDQGAENYKPVRRVVKLGNRFFFDDNITSSGSGGGGGSSSSSQTQIVDSGGEAATVTGGKLDVNATASLAGETLPVAGASEGVAVAIVDGSGNQITSFGGGTQYSDADANADPTGTVAMGTDGSNVFAVHTDTSGDLQVDVLSSALPSGAATSAKQDTLIGHVDGVETLLGTIDGDTSTLAGAVSGTEMQVDVVSGVQTDALTDTQLRATPVPVSGTVTANLSATDNGVLDDIDAVLDTIKVDTEAIETAVEALQAGQLADGHNVTVDNPGDIGGGVQYTEGDIDTTITGNALMVEDASSTLQPAPGDKTNGLDVDVTRSALPTGAATSANQSTANTSLNNIDQNTNGIETLLVAIASYVDGLEDNTTGLATSAKQDTQITAEQAIQTSVELIDDTVRAEDVASADGHKGVVQMAVRQDTPANTSNTDGDYEIPKMSGGRMWVDASGKTLTVDGSGVTQPVSNAGLTELAGAINASAQMDVNIAASGATVPVSNAGLTELAAAINSDKIDVNIKSSDVATGGTSTADDADFSAGTTAGTIAQGVYESSPTTVTDGDVGAVGITSGRRLKTSATIDAALPAGTNNIGDVDVLSSALPTGASTLAEQQTQTTHLSNIATSVGTLDNAISGSEMQVDIVSSAAVPVTDNGSSLTVDNATLTELGDAINSSKVDINLASSDVSIGGGTEYDDGDADATPTGSVAMGTDGSNVFALHTDTSGDLQVDVLSSALPSGAATSAKQDTMIGHLDGVEGVLGTIDTDTGNISTKIDTLAGAVSGTEVQVDVLTMPTTTVQATNLDIRDLTNADVVTAELSATDNAVLDAIAASTAAIDTDTTTLIGHVDGVETLVTSTNTKLDTVNTNLGTIDGRVDGIEGLLTTIDADTGNIATSVGVLDNAISGNEMQVDVVAALPAGTNAIGKLAANSGVDIGDVDVTSAVSATLDHGSNRDIDTSAEQITSTSFACKFGLTLRAPTSNTGILYIGNSDVTAGTTAGTDGIPLYPGDTITIPVSNSNIPYAIASANNQVIYWLGV